MFMYICTHKSIYIHIYRLKLQHGCHVAASSCCNFNLSAILSTCRHIYRYIYIHVYMLFIYIALQHSCTQQHANGNTLQHTETHCNTLQHTATCCNTLLPSCCDLKLSAISSLCSSKWCSCTWYTYIHVYIYVFQKENVFICVCTYIHTYKQTHAHKVCSLQVRACARDTPIHKCLYLYKYMYIYMHMHTYIYIHMYIYKDIYTYQ